VTGSDPELLADLAALDSCAVSDAMDVHGLSGVALNLRPLTGPFRIVGRAMTVELQASEEGQASHRHLATGAIELAEQGDIIIVAHNGRLDVAGWGGILSRAAQVRGIAGVVVDGACRDVDEAREIGFPVFALGATPRTARGRVVEAGFGHPVTIAGVVVRAGDFVIADSTGVVFVAAKHASGVIATARGIAAREAAMTRDVLTGTSVSAVMGTTYEQMTSSSSIQPGGGATTTLEKSE
jgi:regulator of RNase E activity RraA